MIDTDLPEVAVEDIREGDLVDLESCPFLNKYPLAEFELCWVVEVERPTPTTVLVGYDGCGAVTYDVGTKLRVRRNAANQQPLCPDRTV